MRGTTLFEVVVTSALMGLLLTLVAMVTVSGYRYFRRFDATVEVQKNALLGLHWLSRELRESSADGVHIDTSPQGLVFASPRSQDGDISLSDRTNMIEWRGLVCYYRDGPADEDGVLIRKHQALETPRALPPLDLLAERTTAIFRDDTTLQRRVVARHISDFVLVDEKPLQIFLTSEVSSGKRFLVTLSTRVELRN